MHKGLESGLPGEDKAYETEKEELGYTTTNYTKNCLSIGGRRTREQGEGEVERTLKKDCLSKGR